MGRATEATRAERTQIDGLVRHYVENQRLLDTFRQQLLNAILGSDLLTPHIHSVKSRLKDPDHLKDKLIRKLLEAKTKNKKFAITNANLFYKINDLVGLRILHLHTQQIEPISRGLNSIFSEFKYRCIEGPAARTWDDESRGYFKELGFKTKSSPSLYTSVHYVIDSGLNSRCTAELQVRTLAEELWGEVDHSINYPHKSESLSCREQIKALARATSSCSRLVDSIFRTSNEQAATLNSSSRRTSTRRQPAKN